MGSVILGLLIVAATLGVAVVGSVLQQLLRVRFGKPSNRLVSNDSVPEVYRRTFQPALDALTEHGFELYLWIQVESAVISKRRTSYFPVCRAEDGVLAFVHLEDAMNLRFPLRLVFASLHKDGHWVNTHNYHLYAFAAQDPHSFSQDAHCESVAEQLILHRRTLSDRASGEVWSGASPKDIAEQTHAVSQRMHEAHAQDTVEADDGFQLRIVPALRMGWKLMAGSKSKLLDASFPPVETIPIELRVETCLCLDEMRGRRSLRVAWVWTLAGTFLLTLVSFAGWFDADFALLLMVVLALHEGGHYAAMRLSGYKNTRVFFLPFFGGAAMGQPVEASLKKELFVLLAGPLPGAILGIILLAVPFVREMPLLMEFAALLIAINFINLLPLYPLDGGRVLYALVGDLNAFADVLVKIIALVVFAAVWFVLEDPILFLLLAVVLASFGDMDTRSVERECRRDGVAEITDVLPRVLLLPKISGAKAVQKTKLIMERLRSPTPRPIARVLGAIIYGGSLVGIVICVFAVSFPMLFEAPSVERQLLDCENLSDQLSGTPPTIIAADFDSEETADRIGSAISGGWANHCYLVPWGLTPPSEEQLSARRTIWAVDYARAESFTGEDDAISWTEARDRVRSAGAPWLHQGALDAGEPDRRNPSEATLSLLGLEECPTGDDGEAVPPLYTSSFGGSLTVHNTADNPAQLVPLVRYLCEQSAIEIQAVHILR